MKDFISSMSSPVKPPGNTVFHIFSSVGRGTFGDEWIKTKFWRALAQIIIVVLSLLSEAGVQPFCLSLEDTPVIGPGVTRGTAQPSAH